MQLLPVSISISHVVLKHGPKLQRSKAVRTDTNPHANAGIIPHILMLQALIFTNGGHYHCVETAH